MRSCIFRILFRMHEINCMNIHWNLQHCGEKCGMNVKNGEVWNFRWNLGRTNLWKRLWKVCITFCIKALWKDFSFRT